MLPKKLVFIDVETTGTSPTYDRVIEVGLVRIEDDQEVARWQSLVDPEMAVSPYILGMTGITSAMLAGAPVFRQIADDLTRHLNDAVFVAHNARFDFGFLREELARVGVRLRAKQLCTVKLARKLFPEWRRHNLDTVITEMHLPVAARHRAFDDAEVLWRFYRQVRAAFTDHHLAEVIGQLTASPTLPAELDRLAITSLPEGPGVYIFRGANNYPLYVGKSINIRERVRSHFSNDLETTRHLKMCQEVCSIETVETAGELSALLTESQLIKQFQPLYNRQLRRKRELVIASQIEHPQGYYAVHWERLTAIDPLRAQSLIGIFESVRRCKDGLAELAKRYQLCPKLLNLDSSPGSCFSRQLDQCAGACSGEELPIRYNLRFMEAFHRQRIRPWPYPGRIQFIERTRDGERAEVFTLDQWCLLDWTRYQGDDSRTESFPYMFDYDTYRILTKFLQNRLPSSQGTIELVEPAREVFAPTTRTLVH